MTYPSIFRASSDHRLRRADAARLSHRQSGGQPARRPWREPLEPHADRAADLPHHQADIQTLFSASELSFRRVGLVEFPAPGMWSLVFLTQPPSPIIAAHLPQKEHVSAFLPCTPNPTTGFFFYVPRRDVIDLDITVEQAMSLLISAGIIQPGVEDPQNSSQRSPKPRGPHKRRENRCRARQNKTRCSPKRLFAPVLSWVRWNKACQGAMMNFVQAISSGFSNYVNFSDRAIRSEYWYWVLFDDSRRHRRRHR